MLQQNTWLDFTHTRIRWRGTAGHYRHVRTYKAVNARSARSAIIVIPDFTSGSWIRRESPTRCAYEKEERIEYYAPWILFPAGLCDIVTYQRRVHSYLFTLVNPAALGIRTVPRSVADIQRGLYNVMAIAKCHRDHRHIFATRHERRAAVRRPNEYSRHCPTFRTCSPYISLDSHPRGPK